ncbi:MULTISPECIES: lysoplasmalogenase [Streptomyces]|uniref:lysoplasmalogenase n=1 Tax=Streptomyces TaxID=1883 RepID=UPI00140D89E7|nr:MULTISPECIES: lysoplasmalogenase [Streptomyces]MDH6227594.1 putative membrane protein YhhN [Streptomyces sp. MJP52]
MSTPITTGRRAPRLRKALFAAFLLASAVNLVTVSTGHGTVETVSKALLMPLLAATAAAAGAPRTLLVALAFGWGGDVMLSVGGDAFLAGMASFAVGHVAYLSLFRRHGAGRSRAESAGTAVVYAAGLAVLMVLLLPGLPAGLRLPVAGYSCLLTAMAWASGRTGRLAAAGGALFLVSDSLIAAEMAGRGPLPVHGLWVMATYLAAQALLTAGVLGHVRPRERRPAAVTASGSAPAMP